MISLVILASVRPLIPVIGVIVPILLLTIRPAVSAFNLYRCSVLLISSFTVKLYSLKLNRLPIGTAILNLPSNSAKVAASGIMLNSAARNIRYSRFAVVAKDCFKITSAIIYNSAISKAAGATLSNITDPSRLSYLSFARSRIRFVILLDVMCSYNASHLLFNSLQGPINGINIKFNHNIATIITKFKVMNICNSIIV